MKLAAFPKCFMDHIVVERSMSLFDWIAMAADLPIEGVEFHHGFFETLEANYLERVRSALEGRGLAMPMLCCSPDFTKPDPGERRQEVEREKRMIDVSAFLGGGYCRVLSGQRRPEVSREQGIRWVVECIRELLDHAAEKRVVLAMENHYKDNYWGHSEFAQKRDVYLEILNQVQSPWLGAQYDPSNALLAGEDPIELLAGVGPVPTAAHGGSNARGHCGAPVALDHAAEPAHLGWKYLGGKNCGLFDILDRRQQIGNALESLLQGTASNPHNSAEVEENCTF